MASLEDLDQRIAIVRDNIRELTEQAAAYSGAQDESLAADRIAAHEKALADLSRSAKRSSTARVLREPEASGRQAKALGSNSTGRFRCKRTADFAVGFDHPDWHNGFEHDPEAAARVRVHLLTELAATGEQLVATHLPFPSVGRVAVDGDAFRWVPVFWDY